MLLAQQPHPAHSRASSEPTERQESRNEVLLAQQPHPANSRASPQPTKCDWGTYRALCGAPPRPTLYPPLPASQAGCGVEVVVVSVVVWR